MEYQHSVSLDKEKCKGCTNCIKRCPTQAIRVRNGQAVINPAHCIDCGECIRVCPYKAKTAKFDTLAELDRTKYLIALPAPSLFAQFTHLNDADYVLQGLVDIGFNDVYEVSKAAEIVTEYTRRYMNRPDVRKPVISSACPVIVRLMSLRFPSLAEMVMPMIPPIELSGRNAKERALKQHPELCEDDIRTVFISPCPAKVSWVKNLGPDEEAVVDYVVSISEVYFALLAVMNRSKAPEVSTESGMIGLGWAASGGEATSLMNDGYLAADGIENVIRVLDSIENGQLHDLQFVELNACAGGCVGGVMTVENPYIARVRLQTLRRYLPVSRNRLQVTKAELPYSIPQDMLTLQPMQYSNASVLSGDRMESIRMMAEIERIAASLPTLDCGSCGAPTCRAFAEDVVKGEADINSCIVRMREKLAALLKENEGESKK